MKMTDIVITNDEGDDIKIEINLFKKKNKAKRWKRLIDWKTTKI